MEWFGAAFHAVPPRTQVHSMCTVLTVIIMHTRRRTPPPAIAGGRPACAVARLGPMPLRNCHRAQAAAYAMYAHQADTCRGDGDCDTASHSNVAA